MVWLDKDKLNFLQKVIDGRNEKILPKNNDNDTML